MKAKNALLLLVVGLVSVWPPLFEAMLRPRSRPR